MLKKLKQKLTELFLNAKAEVDELRSNEEGMEVIQVLILLAIGLGIILVFMTVGNSLVTAVQEKVRDFLSQF